MGRSGWWALSLLLVITAAGVAGTSDLADTTLMIDESETQGVWETVPANSSNATNVTAVSRAGEPKNVNFLGNLTIEPLTLAQTATAFFADGVQVAVAMAMGDNMRSERVKVTGYLDASKPANKTVINATLLSPAAEEQLGESIRGVVLTGPPPPPAVNIGFKVEGLRYNRAQLLSRRLKRRAFDGYLGRKIQKRAKLAGVNVTKPFKVTAFLESLKSIRAEEYDDFDISEVAYSEADDRTMVADLGAY